MKNILMMTALATVLIGCAANPKETDRFSVAQPHTEVAQIVYDNGIENWSRPYGFFSGDGYIVNEDLMSSQHTSISVQRYSPDAARHKPFFVVDIVAQGEDQTEVVVLEDKPAFFSSSNNFTADVRGWFKPSA